MDELAKLASAEHREAAAAAGAVARWRSTSLALLCLLVAILLLYRDTAFEMVSIWYRSETFAHAFLVPPIVLWLVWRRRATLAALTPQPTLWALLPMAAFGVVWQIGDLANLNSVSQFSMTALLVCAVVGVIGLQVSRAILFPLAFLFFAVPIGEVLVPILMEWTANFTVFALRLSGIPVFREGLSFVIPSGSWSVVEACSGVRYLIASFMVGTLFAHLNYQSTRRRLTFIGMALLVPILANWVRAYLIVLLGHLSSNTLATGVDHLVYGWIFFGFIILLMFWIGAKWAEHGPEPGARHAAGAAQVSSARPTRREAAPRTWGVVAGAGLLAAAPHLVGWLGAGDVPAQPQLQAPEILSERWTMVADKPIDWKPGFVNAAAEIDRVYSSEGRNVGLYIGYYRDQTPSRKLIGSTNVLVRVENHTWNAEDGGTRVVDAGGKALVLRAATLRNRSTARKDLLVWRTYWVNGRFTSDELAARAQIALGKLLGHGDDAAVLVIYTTSPDADKTLEAFGAANLAPIEALLQKTRGAQP